MIKQKDKFKNPLELGDEVAILESNTIPSHTTGIIIGVTEAGIIIVGFTTTIGRNTHHHIHRYTFDRVLMEKHNIKTVWAIESYKVVLTARKSKPYNDLRTKEEIQ